MFGYFYFKFPDIMIARINKISMKKVAVFFSCLLLLFPMLPASAVAISAGDLVRASQPDVYYYGSDGKRYVFPNEKTYDSWYADFSGVKIITDAELAAMPLGGNVTYKPGVKMIKIATDSKVYAVGAGGVLHWVQTEAAALALYGADWNKKIDDVPDTFFVNYKMGTDIASAMDFNVAQESATAVSIDADKQLAVVPAPAPTPTPVPVPAPTYVWTNKTANGDVYRHNGLDLASFNGGYVVSWYDDRNGQNETFFQKLDASGVATGDVARVSNNITDSKNPVASFDGVNMYEFWDDAGIDRRAIYSQKLDHDGNKIKESLFASSTVGSSKNARLAWNATLGKYGVAWWDSKFNVNSQNGDILFSLMNQDGLKSGSEIIVTPTAISAVAPKIISAGDKFGVVWQSDNGSIYFAAVTGEPALAQAAVTIGLAAAGAAPDIAWNGTGYGAAWADKMGDFTDIYFANLDTAGVKIGDAKRITLGGVNSAMPSIVWLKDKFYVAYEQGSAVKVLKVDRNGAILGDVIGISDLGKMASSPKLTVNGDNILIAWLEDDGANNKIMSAAESAQ